MSCQDCCRHVSHQTRHLDFSLFLWSDSTQSANGPVARAFITESSCFWRKPPLHMQQDLSTQFRIRPVLREMWRDSHCRGLKPQFVTLLTKDRNMNSDFWLLKKNSWCDSSNLTMVQAWVSKMLEFMCRRYCMFLSFLEISTSGFVMIIPPLTWVHFSPGSCFADKLSVQDFRSSEAEKANHSHLSHLGDK